LSPPQDPSNRIDAERGEANDAVEPRLFADLTCPTQGMTSRDTHPESRVPPLDLSRGQQVGRYVVLESIGAGGMGVVYRAYDPDLDRHVALKLISGRSSGDATQESRLYREAQALARLSHANVVTVHDVGLHEGRMFVAMELVPGVTLNKWLRETRRTQREILRVFAAAGHGLLAAHEAGLVHRDFKPSNVIVGADGRVRVLDFGLARASGDSASERHEGSLEGEVSSGPLLSSPLTADGVLVGTPHYMAPEQLRHGGGTARSDQFCFCLTLWEALVGFRPYAATSVKELLEKLESGKPDPTPGDGNMPAWVRRILLRGLSPDPAQRFDSMASLLDELKRDPARKRRPLAMVAGTAVVAGLCVALVMGARRDRDARATRCESADAAIREVWNADAQARIRKSFAAHGGPYGVEALKRVEKALGGYADSWAQASREACVSTWIRGTQSEAMLDRQSSCLARRERRLGALVQHLADAKELSTVTGAVPAVLALPAVSDCSDMEALAQGPAAPSQPAQRREMERARAAMAEAESRILGGRSAEGLAMLEPWIGKVRALHYAPLELELLEVLADLETTTPGKQALSERTYDEAFRLAASLGDDRAMARLWVRLVGSLGNESGRPQDAFAQRRAAELSLTRIGVPKGDLRRADLAHNLALSAWNSGRADEALALCREGLSIREQRLGVQHHEVGNSLGLLGILLSERGDYAGGADAHLRALEVYRAALGAHHPYVADSLDNLGVVRQHQGRVTDALRLHEEALALRERLLGRDHPDVGTSLNNVGSVFERTLHIWEKSLSPDDSSLAIALINLADVALARGEAELAKQHCERALSIEQAAVEPDSPTLAWEYTCFGEAETLANRPHKAVPWLEQALTLRSGGDPLERARTELALSRALALAHVDAPRAVELARSAQRAFSSAGPLGQVRLDQSERLLASLGAK
jgi:tetratricopeptide (TPR) repeat protein/predicted Ser/Thr protein kinase